MDTKAWRKILNEANTLLEIVDFLNKPNDSPNENKVQLTLDRKVTGLTAWYRLETDGWWRRINNPGKGYGLLMKKFKISGKPKFDMIGGKSYAFYPVLVVYVPLEYSGEVDWDQPGNYEKAKGTLMIASDRTKATAGDIEKFVNQQIGKGTYTP